MGNFFVYKTVNLVNGKIYVGQTTRNDDGYLGSGIKIKCSIKKYGRENFLRYILCECETKDELDVMEKHWIEKLDSRNPDVGYNIDDGGRGNRMPWNKGRTGVYSKESLSKMKQNHHRYWKGKHRSKKDREKISRSMMGNIKIHSSETKKKIGRAIRGRRAIFNPVNGIVKLVNPEDVSLFIDNGWRLGRK